MAARAGPSPRPVRALPLAVDLSALLLCPCPQAHDRRPRHASPEATGLRGHEPWPPARCGSLALRQRTRGKPPAIELPPCGLGRLP